MIHLPMGHGMGSSTLFSLDESSQYCPPKAGLGSVQVRSRLWLMTVPHGTTAHWEDQELQLDQEPSTENMGVGKTNRMYVQIRKKNYWKCPPFFTRLHCPSAKVSPQKQKKSAETTTKITNWWWVGGMKEINTNNIAISACSTNECFLMGLWL